MRGATPTSIQMSRISSAARPSGRFFSTAMRLRTVSFSSLSKASWAAGALLLVVLRVGVAGQRRDGLLLDLASRPPGAGACPPPGWRRRARRRSARFSSASTALSTCGTSTSCFGLPAFSASSRWAAQIFLISPWAMSRASRIVGLRDLVRARLDHEDGLLGARDHEVERALEHPLLLGVHHEVALGVLADAHGADRRTGTGCPTPSARRRRRSWRGCRRGARGRSTSGSRRAGSRAASPWGRAGAAGGRSCGRSGCPSPPRGPRAGRSCRGSCPRRTCAPPRRR